MGEVRTIKPHGDEPGERGGEYKPVVVLDLFEELDLSMPLIRQQDNCTIAEVCCNDKLAAFHRKYASYTVLFKVSFGDGIHYLVVEHEGEVIVDSCMWILKDVNFPRPIDYGPFLSSGSSLTAKKGVDNVSFSVPVLTYKREDVCGKFPQRHRARLNKPKSI